MRRAGSPSAKALGYGQRQYLPSGLRGGAVCCPSAKGLGFGQGNTYLFSGLRGGPVVVPVLKNWAMVRGDTYSIRSYTGCGARPVTDR
jgi:hypothetical protein